MAMSTGGGGDISAEPNVIPMIDIMLVLLIIFMISQPLTRLVMDVQVPPQETAAVAAPTTAQIVLELTEDGGYAINAQPVPRDQLAEQIHVIYDPRPSKLMFLKSAPDRTYGEVIEAMDIAKGAGVEVIGFTPRM